MVVSGVSDYLKQRYANLHPTNTPSSWLTGVPRTPYPYQASGVTKPTLTAPKASLGSVNTSSRPSVNSFLQEIPGLMGKIVNEVKRSGYSASANADAGMPDFLSQAQGALTGVDYSGVMKDYKGIAAKARARIAAMYNALQGERQGAEALYSGYRDAANQSIGASADQAAADIAAGYQDAVNQQASEMAALGLADTLAQSAAQNMAEDQGYNAATAAKMGASYKNANELGRAADLGYNQGMIGAAGFASAEGRAQIDQQLSQALAQLAMAQEQANAQLPLQQLQYAGGLQSLWQSQQPATPTWSQQLDARKYEDAKQQAQTDYYNQQYNMYIGQNKSREEARQLAADDVAYAVSNGFYR